MFKGIKSIRVGYRYLTVPLFYWIVQYTYLTISVSKYVWCSYGKYIAQVRAKYNIYRDCHVPREATRVPEEAAHVPAKAVQRQSHSLGGCSSVHVLKEAFIATVEADHALGEEVHVPGKAVQRLSHSLKGCPCLRRAFNISLEALHCPCPRRGF